MTNRRDMEGALRSALRHEELSLKRRLPQVLDKAASQKTFKNQAEPRRLAEKAEKHEIVAGKSDVQRLKKLRKRIAKTHPESDKSALWRAGLLALENLSADEIAELIGSLPTMQKKSAKRAKKKIANKNGA